MTSSDQIMISLWSGDTFSRLQVGWFDSLTSVKSVKRGLGLPIVVVIVVKWNSPYNEPWGWGRYFGTCNRSPSYRVGIFCIRGIAKYISVEGPCKAVRRCGQP